MPEFQMNKGGIVLSTEPHPDYAGFKPDGAWTFHGLDAFTQGYIEALFFTECDPSVTAAEVSPGHEFADGSIPSDVGFSDLSSQTLASIIADCEAFQRDNADDIAAAVEAGRPLDHCGHDFWLTRNGHGAGFWDRGLGEVGDRLSDASRAYASADAYFGDDGRVYL